MTSIDRRVTIVMLSVMVCQIFGLYMMLRTAAWTRIEKLFAFDPAIWLAWICGLVLSAIYVAISIRRLPLIGRRFFDVTPLKVLAIPFSLMAGAVEELIFRRVLMDSVSRHGFGAVTQVVASAVVFGLMHASFGLFAKSWNAVLAPMFATTLLGAALAGIYLLARRSVAPCIWSHALIDIAIEPWLLVAVISKAQHPRQSLEP